MSDVVIRVENLGKQYRLGQRKRYNSLRESLVETLKHPLRRFRPSRNGQTSAPDTFWALKDVSFEVKQGEVVGIIGRNGAGKSTLLKILSRITEPTEGEVELTGRVGSLLEVGTGFHPELTGRENVYLNGAILGMRREEITRKFDEIVAFAEVEKFIDTPVKHYSSGMYVRLAFAVAAHLEPEILVVDEVLAVGDAQFQKKCLGKMGEAAHSGRTVLFVSHNMGTVNRLCESAVWLDHGKLRFLGRSESVVSQYLMSNIELTGQRTWTNPDSQPGNAAVRLVSVNIVDHEGTANNTFDMRHPIEVAIEYRLLKPMRNLRMSIRVLTEDGTTVFMSTDQNCPFYDELRPAGHHVSLCRIPGNLLNAGSYLLSAGCDIPFTEVLFFEEMTLGFRVEQTGGINSRYPERWPGLICPDLHWKIIPGDKFNVQRIGEVNGPQ
jgi:lipopolysaccharide transport system ATP-binding protein